MSDDPFDDLDVDAYRDREGDPFEAFDEDDPDDGSQPRTDDESEPWTDADRVTPSDERGTSESPGTSGDPVEYLDGEPTEEGDAFGDVDVSRGDPFESADSPFRQVDVDSVDPDEVWERFTGEAERVEQKQSEALGGESVPEDAAEVVEVPKGRFCQTCPHFSAPPETACSHPGTEVLTFVGTDEVRVSNCPVVRERRELGETYE